MLRGTLGRRDVAPVLATGRTRTLVGMITSVLLDAAGRRRSPAAMPGHHCGRPPRNKGLRYPRRILPAVEEIVAVMRFAGNTPYGLRTRALIVILWRTGPRISEALALTESDLHRATGGVLVRRGKGDKRREVGTDRWGWQQLAPWLDVLTTLPVGALLCVIAALPAVVRGHHQPLARRSEASPQRRRPS